MAREHYPTFAHFRRAFGLDDRDPAFHVPLPPLLFKYRAWGNDFTKRMLEKGEYYFPSAQDLNDPFEFDTYLRDGVNFRDPDHVDEYAFSLKRLVEVEKNRGILSLSAVADNILMWSHYAASHSGICVALRTDVLLLAMAQWAGNAHSFELVPVNYVNNFRQILSRAVNEDDETFVRRILATKSEAWSYEQEFRIIWNHRDKEENSGFNPKIALLGKMESDVVYAVYAGCWFRSAEVPNLMKSVGVLHPHAEVKGLARDPSEFALIDQTDDDDLYQLLKS